MPCEKCTCAASGGVAPRGRYLLLPCRARSVRSTRPEAFEASGSGAALAAARSPGAPRSSAGLARPEGRVGLARQPVLRRGPADAIGGFFPSAAADHRGDRRVGAAARTDPCPRSSGEALACRSRPPRHRVRLACRPEPAARLAPGPATPRDGVPGTSVPRPPAFRPPERPVHPGYGDRLQSAPPRERGDSLLVRSGCYRSRFACSKLRAFRRYAVRASRIARCQARRSALRP